MTTVRPGRTSSTTGSPVGGRRHTRPSPARKYQISSTVRWRTGRLVSPAGSRTSTRLAVRASPTRNVISEPSGAIASGTGLRYADRLRRLGDRGAEPRPRLAGARDQHLLAGVQALGPGRPPAGDPSLADRQDAKVVAGLELPDRPALGVAPVHDRRLAEQPQAVPALDDAQDPLAQRRGDERRRRQ